MIVIGFLIYRSCDADRSACAGTGTEKAAGTAAGFTGLFGYLSGSVAAGAIVGYTVDFFGWDGGFMVMIGGSILAVILLIVVMIGEKRRHEQLLQNATEANGMKLKLKNLSMAIMMSTIVIGSSAMAADSNEKIVIAHRGASGYFAGHTLPAKAMAYAQGADYLEQDLVMTKDDHLVVLHDHYLDRVTDVADRFPDRARKDGRYYAIDFTLDEIKSLKFTEGFDIENGKKYRLIRGVSQWVSPTSGAHL